MRLGTEEAITPIAIVLRPIPHSSYEIAMGHCIFYPAIDTDAISCTYNMDGFSPMKAVLRAHGLDEFNFQKSRRYYENKGERFLTCAHGEPFPNIITSTKTATWNEVPSAAVQILMNVETHYCKSLCMTHFSFILGKFPAEAFSACMRTVNMAWAYSELKKIVVDVDERFFDDAIQIWRQVRNGVVHEN